MVNRKFEISRRAFIRKCSAAILLGSLIPTWVFIIWNYYSTIKDQGYYSAPASFVQIHLICIPICGYQLPAYLISGLICIDLIKRGWIKSDIVAYLGVGISGWIVGTVLLSILLINGGSASTIQAIELAFLAELPSLFLYLVFLLPKSADREHRPNQ